MPSHVFYPPPPMPQRTVPPRIYFTPGIITTTPDIVVSDTRRQYINRILAEQKAPAFIPSYFLKIRIAPLLPIIETPGTPPLIYPLGLRVFSILSSYSIYTPIPPRIVSPNFIHSLITTPPPFTRKDKHLDFKSLFSDLGIEERIIFRQRRSRYPGENPTFTSGYLIAFQPNAFQVAYPGIYNAFQGMNRFIEIPLVEVIEVLHINLGPQMKEYRRGTSIPIRATISDPSQKPPLLYNPEAVRLTLINPLGIEELTLQAMYNIDQGIFEYIWQSDSTKPLGVYKEYIQGTSGPNSYQTIAQGTFKLV